MAEYGVECSTLPEEYEKVAIKDMLPGETAYTVPWSLWIKKDGSGAINGLYDFKEEPLGTFNMQIQVSENGDKIKVYLRSVKEHRFNRSDEPPHLGFKEEDYIPVTFVK